MGKIKKTQKKDYLMLVGKENEWDTTPRFTVIQMAKMIGISEHTVRYYENLELFPFVSRDENNVRLFSLTDAFFGRAIACFREVGMPIKECRKFIELTLKGDVTAKERQELIKKHEKNLKKQLIQLQKNLQEIEYKRMFFDTIVPEIEKEKIEGNFKEKGRSTLKASRIFIQNKMYEAGLIDKVEIDIEISEK